MQRDRHGLLGQGMLFAVVALLVRVPLLDFLTPDTTKSVIPWYEKIVAQGYAALGGTFPETPGGIAGNYTPVYYYMLFAASYFQGLLPEIYLIKAISIIFDALAGIIAYRIARFYTGSPTAALIASALVCLSPTDLANGAWWGQCDMIWTSALLGVFYLTLVQRPLAAAIVFGIALSFKAQSIFLGPYLLMLCLAGQMRYFHLAAVPLAYAAMMLPAIALGRDPLDVFLVYVHQGERFEALSMNAPNLYVFISDAYYKFFTVSGLLLTAAASFALALLPKLYGVRADARLKLLAATMFVALSPFLLPKMHDRYFFAADIFSILLAFSNYRLWPIPLALQLSSLLAYSFIISLSLTGSIWTTMIPVAALLNTATVGCLVYLYWKACRGEVPAGRQEMTEFSVALAAIGAVASIWIGVALATRYAAARICAGGSRELCSWELNPNLLNANLLQRLLFFAVLAGGYWTARRMTRQLLARPK